MKEKLCITGVILAGGQSSRMGVDKALVEWQGKRLVDYLLEQMHLVCDEILISTHLPQENFPNQKAIPDLFGACGPIAGIESGLRHASCSSVVFASVDSPLLTSELFQYLISSHGDFEISLAAHRGINEPMIGVYDKDVLPKLQAYILSGKSKPPEFIRSRRWQEIDIHSSLPFYHPDLFKNMNTPKDLV